MKKNIYFILALFLISTGHSVCQQKMIKALIIDGQNNHAIWPKSTIMIKQYLEETSLFCVDVARTKFIYKSTLYKEWLSLANTNQTLTEGDPKIDTEFKPNFSNYDVVISNFGYKTASWPAKTKIAFEKYIKNGGGFVSIHAADNCFPNWPEYNEIIGIGGWGGRTVAHGPYLYINKENKIQKDYSEGKCGAHGKKQEFIVTSYNNSHPIMVGIPKEWMHSTDECYAYLRGPAKNVTILATAVSTKKNPKLQHKEPVVMTIKYHKGRIFHTTLGHDETSLSSVGLITLIQRGTEWAATNKVSIKVPEDFPDKTKSSLRTFKYKK